MRLTAVCLLLTLVAVATLTLACSPEPPDETDYVGHIEAARVAKDAELMRTPELVPEARKADFLPLEYYPINPAFNVPAVLTPSTDMETVFMPTSAGTQDPMRKVGTLDFTLRGEQLRLTAYAPAADRSLARLFVPFRDPTSETDTYAAGRYLDLDRTATGMYELDFNLAYNPNCYFNPMWICPLPPRENHLPIPIEAGERIRAVKDKA